MIAADLPAIAAIAIACLVSVYVAFDGLDIGVGILFMGAPTREDRDAVVASTAATRFVSGGWLLAAAATMWAAFPFPFWALAQALSLPIIIMCAALALREFALARRRGGDADTERRWSVLFALCSILVALAQGFCLGGYIKGVSVARERFIGGLADWVAPFSFLVAIALVTGYALLGSAWLMIRSPPKVRERARRWTMGLSVAALVAVFAISAAMLTVHPTISVRWGLSLDGVDWRYFLPLAPLPITATGALLLSFFGAANHIGAAPFLGALGAFAASYGGLAISVWPYVVPYGFEAATSAADAHDITLALTGAAVAAPLLFVLSVVSFKRRRA